MKNVRFSDAQIMGILKKAEGGVPVSELCHEHALTVATNCRKNPDWIEAYLKGDRSQPFIQVAAMNIWIGTGTRARQKINGRFVELCASKRQVITIFFERPPAKKC